MPDNLNSPDSILALQKIVEAHGKMPDVVVHFVEKNWLVLIEATTSHGPINPKRRNELKAIFGNSTAGLVFVTAFDRRSDMARYIQDLRKIMEKRTTKDTKDTKLRRFQRVLA